VKVVDLETEDYSSFVFEALTEGDLITYSYIIKFNSEGEDLII
jgi:hypothetical protein